MTLSTRYGFADAEASREARKPDRGGIGEACPSQADLAQSNESLASERDALSKEIANLLMGYPVEYLADELRLRCGQVENLLRSETDGFPIAALRGIARHYRHKLRPFF